MAYPKENLHANESLVLDLHPHWWFFTPALAALVASVLVGVWAIVDGPDWLKIPVALVIVVTLGWFGSRYAQWTTTDLVLTTDRLIWRQGVVAKHGIEIPLDRINTIFFTQRVFERLLGVGDLKVESASEQGAQVFENMRRPARIQNEIYQQMESNENRKFDRVAQGLGHAGVGAPVPPAAPAAPDITEQIERLAELRDRGVLTEAEFQAKKTDLLNRL